MSTKYKSPSAKCENIFLAAIKSKAVLSSPLNGFQIRTGRPPESEGIIAGPKVIDVWVEGAHVVPELEDEYEGNLHIRVTAQADDNDATDLDSCVAFIIRMVMFPASRLKTFANYPNSARPEPDFWLVDVYQTNEEMATSGRYFLETPVYLVKFRDDNGQG